MKTPITENLSLRFHENESATFADAYVEMREFARRLELDRAALMVALELLVGEETEESAVMFQREKDSRARAALASARTNFPEP